MVGERYTNNELSLPGRRRRRAAPDWSRRGAPPAPKSISQLLAERDFAGCLATVDPTPANRAADRAACDALAEARRKVAAEFGAPYGWRPGKGFALTDLCGFHNSRRRYREVREPREMFDHPWYFRWPGGRGPAAVVSQPYKPAFDLEAAREFAARNELIVSVADAFESWWSPGQCVIAVWERGEPRQEGVRWTPGPWARP